VQELKLRLNY